ncbi:GNAT family N-acetyltransferase [Arsenicicoccus piscis]|uniref:GNAT family N-acetyltransferase n=1 Tax=Arsenicicoccus piscis TaxID=673954 RepID=UPI001F4CB0A6|nr:GNAT family N-acetyltransferase [Arsenicicoccus piscis]
MSGLGGLLFGTHAWPVRLRGQLADGGRILLRELRVGDQRDWLDCRTRNWDWLQEWEPTAVDKTSTPVPFRTYVRSQQVEARAGRSLPWIIEIDGRIAGALTISQIAQGVLLSGAAGYWVAKEHAGRGVVPLALALAMDYAFDERRLHRIEVNIRPENANSLAVVRKLGFRDEGLRVRYLHINHAWRDHRTFALTTEDLDGGRLVDRSGGSRVSN